MPTFRTSLLTSLKAIILALLLSVGISYLYAAWANPTDTPPNGNTPAPINVGSTGQTKTSSITATDLIGQNSVASPFLQALGGSDPKVTSPKYCIGTDCITAWPSGGGAAQIVSTPISTASVGASEVTAWTLPITLLNSVNKVQIFSTVHLSGSSGPWTVSWTLYRGSTAIASGASGYPASQGTLAISHVDSPGTASASYRLGLSANASATLSPTATSQNDTAQLVEIGAGTGGGGGITGGTCSVGQYVNAISTSGVPTCSTPPGGGGGVPSGMIGFFAGACPSGWTTYTAADGRHIRASNAGTGATGNDPHVHSYRYWYSESGGQFDENTQASNLPYIELRACRAP